jgi:alpha-tubulin suppressor-like RCC1 family protein
MKLLLVDSAVNYGKLVDARKHDVDYIVFDSNVETYHSLAAKIAAKGSAFTDIALVQHGGPSRQGNSVRILAKEPMWNSADPSSLDSFKKFIRLLKKRICLRRFDMLACALYSNQATRDIISRLEAETGVDFRASTNFTGNAEAGADWIMESDNVDIREVYFTDKISGFKEVLYTYTNSSMFGSNKVIKDICGNFIFLHKDICGNPINPPCDLSGLQFKYPSGSVITWGASGNGGSNNTGVDLSGVISIYSTATAFAALKSDGSVVVWGDPTAGGSNEDGGSGYNAYTGKPSDLSGVVSIYSGQRTFSAVKSDGSVVVWGRNSVGGSNSDDNDEYAGKPADLSGVISIYSVDDNVVALKSDGSVATWGSTGSQNKPPSYVTNPNSGVVAIYSTNYLIVALKSDGSVVSWGSEYQGGPPSSVTNPNSNVVSIYSINNYFAALKSDGSVVFWGKDLDGVMVAPASVTDPNSGVEIIYSTNRALAALKSGGKVVTWGDAGSGGNSAGVSSELQSGVITIYSTQSAFAALKSGGKVVTWGNAGEGGDSSSVSGELLSGVTAIYSTYTAFAALKSGGKVITWGSAGNGGNSLSVSSKLSSGVTAIYSTESAFAALKSDGSVVVWGSGANGGSDEDGNGYTGKPSNLSGVIAIYSTGSAFAVIGSLTNDENNENINTDTYNNEVKQYNVIHNKNIIYAAGEIKSNPVFSNKFRYPITQD